MTPMVVLGIDQARSSGWCIATPADFASGVVKTAEGRAGVVAAALRTAEANGLRLVTVLEDHSGFAMSRGNLSMASRIGLGAARGWWEQALEERGVSDVHTVEPRVWRKAVLGLGNVKSEQAKAAAVLHARAVTGQVLPDDAAEAVCIALWARRNVVLKTARQRARKA